MRYFRVSWRWLVGLLLVAYVVVAWVYASGAMSGTVLVHDIPLVDGVAEEPVEIDNGEIVLDAGFYQHPDGGDCAVVMIHGVNDDRESVLDFAPIYWELGCSLLAFDQRDHGRSTPAARTYGYHEAGDAEHAVAWLLRRTGLAPEDVGVHGISFGAATALELLERRDDLAFIVADSPYSSMGAIVSYTAGDSLGIFEPLLRPLAYLFIEMRADMEVGKVDATDAVRNKSTPILVMHTAGDTDVPPAQSAAVARANPAIERHLLQADGVHLQAYRMRPGVYTDIVHEFIARRAPGFVG